MGFDITSYLMGQKAGGGGGSSLSPAIWQVGFYGRDEMSPATSITVTIDGYNGKYALIAVGHRADLTAPAGCTLLDKSTFQSKDLTQYVSVYKYHVASASESLVFTQASSARIAATAWALNADFSLTKADTKTEATNIYTTPVEVTTKEFSFVTFSAAFAQPSSGNYEWPVSNGVWINADLYVKLNHNFCRFYTGIIPASSTEHIVYIGKDTDHTSMKASGEGAQVVVYTIGKA